MSKKVSLKIYHMWYSRFKHICDNVDDFVEWLSSVDFYNDISKKHNDIKIIEIGGSNVAVPKKLWMKLFLRISFKGYRKMKNCYSVRISSNGDLNFYGSFKEESRAAEHFVRIKIALAISDFSDCPYELIRIVVNDFVEKYYLNHKTIDVSKFLL